MYASSDGSQTVSFSESDEENEPQLPDVGDKDNGNNIGKHVQFDLDSPLTKG